MKKNIKALILTVIVSLTFAFNASVIAKNSSKTKELKSSVAVQKVTEQKPSCDNGYDLTSSLAIVANPDKYLNRKVKIRAKFDKFSTLGLDYKPAYRSSDKYITFLIKRDNIVDHTIPLSELKNFIARDDAEKYIDLKPGDEIEYCGTVFSNALGDAWLSVDKFTVLSQKSKDKNSDKK